MGKLTEFPLESENEIRMPNNTLMFGITLGNSRILGGKMVENSSICKTNKINWKTKKIGFQ